MQGEYTMDKIKIENVFIERRFRAPDIGIIAKARVRILDKLQIIASGGFWGSALIQHAIIGRQFSELSKQLIAIGAGIRAVEYAIKQWNGKIIDK